LQQPGQRGVQFVPAAPELMPQVALATVSMVVQDFQHHLLEVS